MRRVLVVVGSALTVGGLVLALVPSLAATFSTSGAFVVLVGIVATLKGASSVLVARREADGPAEPPHVESRTGVTVPGRAFDRSLAAGSASIRERLRDTAVDVLADSPRAATAANASLDAGDWTDDRDAAAFFSASVTPPAEGFDAPDPRDQARHVVRELGRRLGVEWDEPEPNPSIDRDAPATLEARNRDAEPGDPWYVPRQNEVVTRENGKWAGLVGLALVAGGAGVALTRPALVVVAGLATAAGGGVAITRAGTMPAPSLSVTRTVTGDDVVAPGETVAVETTIRNDADHPLHDLRFVDGVPSALVVTDGAARKRCSLAPGETTTLTYELRAERGMHAFQQAHVVVGDQLGERETVTRAGPTEQAFACTAPPEPVDPVARDQAASLVGSLPSNVAGEGIEFHSLREYRRGDPLTSIDWNRLARTGELATRRFTEERRACVVVVVDARESAYVGREDADRIAVDRCVDAADVVLNGLLDDGHAVGLTALSAATETCWVPPRSGGDHRVETRRTLATSAAIPATPPGGRYAPSVGTSRLLTRLSESTQVVLCSPLVDDYPVDLAKTLEARGHRTTIVAPDPTGDATTGERLATVERLARASTLRSTGVPVYDWASEAPLALALAHGQGGTR